MAAPPVVLEGVSHAYGRGRLQRQVLFDIDATVEPGEIVLLTGPSGSGKTTLLTLAGALRSAQSGSVRVLGRELRGASERTLVGVRRQIGFIFQSHHLLESLTALENVLLSLRYHPTLHGRRALRAAREALEAVGLADHLKKLPRALSGGQRQRVAVARALAGSPSLVLADEPTASLDKATGREVIDRLRGLALQQGTSVLLVTHDHRILDVADRILHLEDGRLESLTSAVMSSTENLMASLASTARSGGLVRQLEALSGPRFLDLLERVTDETRRFVEVVRMSQSDAYESLLEQVLEVFTRKIGALLDGDRVTLFLVDRERGEIWSRFGPGDGEGPLEIRLPLGRGIAGSVAASGETMNIPDAYAEPLFDRSTDDRTGFRTRSILCAPVRDAEGRVLAVAQVLNKRGGGPFTGDDETVFSEFAESIGVVLESWQQMRAMDPPTGT